MAGPPCDVNPCAPWAQHGRQQRPRERLAAALRENLRRRKAQRGSDSPRASSKRLGVAVAHLLFAERASSPPASASPSQMTAPSRMMARANCKAQSRFVSVIPLTAMR